VLGVNLVSFYGSKTALISSFTYQTKKQK